MIEFDWAIMAIITMLIILCCVFSCWWCNADSNNERLTNINYINEVEQTYTTPTAVYTPRAPRRFEFRRFGSKK